MKYLAPQGDNSFSPKILGSYENELHAIFKQILSMEFDRIVDIGAAEGYYAVGLAMYHPKRPEIIAYEADKDEQAMIAELARMNCVEVTVLGMCEPSDLAAVMTQKAATLVICDTEGYERELLDPEAMPALCEACILVELHEFVHAGIGEVIRDRFLATHDVKEIQSRARGIEDLPNPSRWGRWIPKRILVRAMQEGRPDVMQWLWMRPINATKRFADNADSVGAELQHPAQKLSS